MLRRAAFRGVFSVPSWADWNHWKFSPGAEWYWSKLGRPDEDRGVVRRFHESHYPGTYYQDFAPKVWNLAKK